MKQEKENQEKKFRICSYRKSELAAFYFPGMSTTSALKNLRDHIKKHPTLPEALSKTGLTPHTKLLTPLQVRMIVTAIGLP